MLNSRMKLLGGTVFVVALFSVVLVPGAVADPPGGIEGFDCTIQTDPQYCVACSGCSIDPVTNETVCGQIRKLADCQAPQVAECRVGTGLFGLPTYSAECVAAP